ncbi:MAG: TolC family protein [Candidatus Sumerlaeaceae bacterium]
MATVSAKYGPEKKVNLPRLRPESRLSDFLVYGMLNSPEVEAAYHDWITAVEKITGERSLPDPRLTLQADIAQMVTSLMPGAMFDLSAVGKLKARADVQSAESFAKYYEFESAVYKTAFNIKRSYYQLYFLEEKTKVNQRILELLKDLEEIARRRNELSLGSLDDVLRIQIEEERLKTEIANLEESRKSLLAQFKAALGIRPDRPDPPIPASFQTTSLTLREDALLKAALKKKSFHKGA